MGPNGVRDIYERSFFGTDKSRPAGARRRGPGPPLGWSHNFSFATMQDC